MLVTVTVPLNKIKLCRLPSAHPDTAIEETLCPFGYRKVNAVCGLPALWRFDDPRGLLSWITAYGLAIVLKKPFSHIRMPKKKV